MALIQEDLCKLLAIFSEITCNYSFFKWYFKLKIILILILPYIGKGIKFEKIKGIMEKLSNISLFSNLKPSCYYFMGFILRIRFKALAVLQERKLKVI